MDPNSENLREKTETTDSADILEQNVSVEIVDDMPAVETPEDQQNMHSEKYVESAANESIIDGNTLRNVENAQTENSPLAVDLSKKGKVAYENEEKAELHTNVMVTKESPTLPESLDQSTSAPAESDNSSISSISNPNDQSQDTPSKKERPKRTIKKPADHVDSADALQAIKKSAANKSKDADISKDTASTPLKAEKKAPQKRKRVPTKVKKLKSLSVVSSTLFSFGITSTQRTGADSPMKVGESGISQIQNKGLEVSSLASFSTNPAGNLEEKKPRKRGPKKKVDKVTEEKVLLDEAKTAAGATATDGKELSSGVASPSTGEKPKRKRGPKKKVNDNTETAVLIAQKDQNATADIIITEGKEQAIGANTPAAAEEKPKRKRGPKKKADTVAENANSAEQSASSTDPGATAGIPATEEKPKRKRGPKKKLADGEAVPASSEEAQNIPINAVSSEVGGKSTSEVPPKQRRKPGPKKKVPESASEGATATSAIQVTETNEAVQTILSNKPALLLLSGNADVTSVAAPEKPKRSRKRKASAQEANGNADGEKPPNASDEASAVKAEGSETTGTPQPKTKRPRKKKVEALDQTTLSFVARREGEGSPVFDQNTPDISEIAEKRPQPALKLPPAPVFKKVNLPQCLRTAAEGGPLPNEFAKDPRIKSTVKSVVYSKMVIGKALKIIQERAKAILQEKPQVEAEALPVGKETEADALLHVENAEAETLPTLEETKPESSTAVENTENAALSSVEETMDDTLPIADGVKADALPNIEDTKADAPLAIEDPDAASIPTFEDTEAYLRDLTKQLDERDFGDAFDFISEPFRWIGKLFLMAGECSDPYARWFNIMRLLPNAIPLDLRKAFVDEADRIVQQNKKGRREDQSKEENPEDFENQQNEGSALDEEASPVERPLKRLDEENTDDGMEVEAQMELQNDASKGTEEETTEKSPEEDLKTEAENITPILDVQASDDVN